MHVVHLSLHDFRSYPTAEVALGPGVTAFVGRNGQGKTNLVEAVGYLADRLAKLGVEKELFAKGAVAGATVVIGGRDGMVFDWEPTLTSAAELMTAPRGTDARLDALNRPTTAQRRQSYKERMDAKAEARAELERERQAGIFDAEDEE